MAQDTGENATIVVGHATGAGGGTGGAGAPNARLICLDDTLLDQKQKGLVISLVAGVRTIGRNPDNTDPIFYQGISSRHARLFPLQGRWAIEDLGSTNGIWIKGVREKHAFLVPGDFIKIGSIPFQFVLDDPSSASLSAVTSQDVASQGGGGTIYASSNEADKIAETLTAAQAETKVDEKRREEASKSGATSYSSSSSVGSVTSERKQSSKMPLVAVLVLLLAGGGYGLYTMKGPDGADRVQHHHKEIKKFLDQHEVTKVVPSAEGSKSQTEWIEALLEPLSADVKKYSANQDLKELLSRLRFLWLERQLVLFEKEGRVQEVDPLIAQQLDFVSASTDQAESKGSEKQTWRDDMKGLLQLAKDVVAVKQFRQQYPQPSKEAAARPSKETLETVKGVSKRIVEQKRSANVHKLLSVQFSLFGRIVADVDEYDLPLILQWNELL